MAARTGDITRGFTGVDQTPDARFFIDFLDARETIEGETEVKQLILDMLHLQPGLRMLDVGDGTGDDVRELAARVGLAGQVLGIDPSNELIAESKRRSAGSALPVEFRIGDARKLDFSDASRSLVFTACDKR